MRSLVNARFTQSIRFAIRGLPRELKPGLDAIRSDQPHRFGNRRDSVGLRFETASEMPPGRAAAEQSSDETVLIRYGSRSAAFRMLGCLLALPPKTLGKPLRLVEDAAIDMRGLMLDCSRNGVLRPEAARAFMRRVALMGVNMLMLYTEDTYEIPGEPFFGYLRGAYSRSELKALDDYANNLGIELIPCIQTLGHLEQILQWPAYADCRDTDSVLLAGHEPAYALIRKMIRAVSAPLRSKRIHVGMDEAMGVGTGRFRQRFGEKPPFDILNNHLARVRDICREEGLAPMIWSDMFFRLGTRSHDYYDAEWTIPETVVDQIPRDVQLVYWDYYHDDPAFYRNMIANHRKLGSEPLMGGGIWTWSHFWCALPWTFTSVDACMQAVRAEGLREVFMTLWGDEGMEVDLFSALPGIQFFCEHAFNARNPMQTARGHFEAVCGSPFDAWVRAADVDAIPLVRNPEKNQNSAARALLWQDPLLAILDPFVGRTDLRAHYRELARSLEKSFVRNGLSRRLELPWRLAQALEIKAHFRRDLARAYHRNDRAELERIAGQGVRDLRRVLRRLWKTHRTMWMDTYKPFGWEVIENRYGGLLVRVETVRDRLRDYLRGRIETIPELEARLRDPWPEHAGDFPLITFNRAKTPSCIK